MKERVCLIDGSGYIFRAYFASPKMTNPEGLPVNAVYGFLNMFLSLTANIDCDYCLVLFDAKRQNFRNEFYADYKATRPELPDDLKPQFKLIHEAVEALNLNWLQMEGYEADDLIATYTDLALKEGKDVTIVSADKDLMQLIRDGVEFYDGMKNKFFTKEDVKEKFGVYPERVVDVQALAGDSTDNVPGVPGIGLKTAAELVNTFGSLEGVLENAHMIKQNKRREVLMEHKDDALVSLKLVTLKPDVKVEKSIDDFRCLAPNPDVLNKLLDRHAFKSLKNKASNWLRQKCSCLPEDAKKEEVKVSYKLVTSCDELKKISKDIREKNIFAFKPYVGKDGVVGIGVSYDVGNGCYIPIAKNNDGGDLFSISSAGDGVDVGDVKKILISLFEDKSVLKVCFNLKDNLHILSSIIDRDFDIEGYDDVSVMSYDLFSSEVVHDVANLSVKILDKELRLAGEKYKKIDFGAVGLEEIFELISEEVDFTLRIHQILKEKLFEDKKLFIYEAMDRPLIKVLYEMEKEGIALDALKLKELDVMFDSKLNALSKEIYEIAGEEFNLSSPKQVGEVLYTKLGLKGKKHTSGSLNTSAEVLEKMAENHVLPQKILEWRQYQKLKSTYTTALLNLMDRNNRVHTTYSQISVNTGRLSSLNPNLQNIPIRTDIGREIRKCFVAKNGCKIVAVDYSQVELRLLATIANVKFLENSFNDGVDIHRKTASQVFGVAYDEVSSMLRRRAKAINFGIVYGMSAYGLSKEIEVSVEEANQYIKSYFENMPEIKEYMENTINKAKLDGYVETMFGRKISIFGIKDDNKRMVQFGERAAINAPIQGSASDIIKLSMIKCFYKLKGLGLKTKMLLQVHDELVFEVPDEEVEIVSKVIKETMEDVTNVALKVLLIAEVGVGNNWEEAH